MPVTAHTHSRPDEHLRGQFFEDYSHFASHGMSTHLNLKELIIKSLNVRLCILYIFKNSTGTNKTNNETQNRIKNQNKPCAFQVMIDFYTIPTDSSKRYVE